MVKNSDTIIILYVTYSHDSFKYILNSPEFDYKREILEINYMQRTIYNSHFNILFMFYPANILRDRICGMEFNSVKFERGQSFDADDINYALSRCRKVPR